MKRKPIAILAASLFAATAAAQQADDKTETTGSVTLGVRGIAANANDASKLNEYRDLDSGVAAGFELRRRSDTDYLNGYGENLGREDQYIDLNGGSYGNYKFRAYADYLRHNFGSGPGALTPYSGIGTTSLTATLPNSNVATWHQFDHAYKRRELGAMFELQKTSPWYTRAEYNEVTRKGVNVIAGANGTSPGNGFMDLPAPIDFTTRNYFAEGGYSGGRSHFAANVLYSTFDNGNDALRWQNGFFNGMDTTVLPPDNQMLRLAANGNVRRLPGDSTLAARLTYARLMNNVGVLQNTLSTGATNPATNPNEPNFRGDVRRTDFNISLASRPLAALDTRVFWNYYNETNHSTEMTFNPAVGSGLRLGSTDPRVNCANVAGTLCAAEMYHLKRNTYGAEAGYRVTSGNKVMTGFDYTHADRERVDFAHTDETKWFAEWKNTSLDMLSGRIKYQYLARRSTFDENLGAIAANPMDLYVRRFDLANVNQNLVKLVLDASPFARFDIGFEAIFKRNNFSDTPLGRRDDTRQEYYASVAYGDPQSLRGIVYGDVEWVRYDATHRVGTGNPDPITPPTTTTYNWDSQVKDRSWQVGAGLDWVPVSRLKVKSSALYGETRGTADFMVQPGGDPTPHPAITNFHNTRFTSFTVRGIYEVTKEWEFTAGYAFERYRYSDIGYDNTKYVTTPVTTSSSYVTGQYSFQPYTANIVFGVAKYKF